MVLREPFERTDDAAVSSKPPYRENDDGKTVTLNVEVVPGLYYAADSAATIEALKRPSATEPSEASTERHSYRGDADKSRSVHKSLGTLKSHLFFHVRVFLYGIITQRRKICITNRFVVLGAQCVCAV